MILSSHLFCLLNLSTTPQFCSPLLLSYTFDILNLIRQHNQPNTIRYLLCAIYYALYTMHYTLCTMHYLLCPMYYALCIMHYTLFTMYYTLCTMHYALFTMHYALRTMYYVLYSMHYLLCTMHYAFVFICIHTYLLFYTYSYVFTISCGNPTKSRDFGTHA